MVLNLGGHGENFLCPDDNFIFTQILLFGIVGEKHFECAIKQEGSEQIHYPVEMLNQRGTCKNKRPAKKDRSNDSPKQNPMLEFVRDFEISEYGCNHKYIVKGKRFFDDVAGQIFQNSFRTAYHSVDMLNVTLFVQKVNSDAEQERKNYPDESPDKSFGNPNFVVFFMKNSQVKS